MSFADADLLPLSALQHFIYCPRQCALIHLEQQWAENRFTAEGRAQHDRPGRPSLPRGGAWIKTRSTPKKMRHLGASFLGDGSALRFAGSSVLSAGHCIVGP